MLKLAKVVDEKTKKCIVAFGTNEDYYLGNGFSEMDVEKSYLGDWYLEGYAPEKPAPTHEEVEQMRIEYRHLHIDDKTIARMRKTANGTWTEEDEAAYLALDEEVTAYIEEHYPYAEEDK